MLYLVNEDYLRLNILIKEWSYSIEIYEFFFPYNIYWDANKEKFDFLSRLYYFLIKNSINLPYEVW